MAATFKIGNECGYELLCIFGKTEITNKNLDKFGDGCYELYHKKLHQFDLEKLPPISSSMRQQILRAYLQCYL